MNWKVKYNDETITYNFLCPALIFIKYVGGKLIFKTDKEYVQKELF